VQAKLGGSHVFLFSERPFCLRASDALHLTEVRNDVFASGSCLLST
jgi:hypothetical protein